MGDPTDLTGEFTGKLLIAMPGMADPRFTNAVVFLCAHSDDGAMGLMLNRPTKGVTLADLFDQLSIEDKADTRDIAVMVGGPVDEERGFVLHSSDYASALSTMNPIPEIAMTATMDIMQDIAAGRGPRRRLVTLGYCGWGGGQLERELSENAWLTCDASLALVFDTKPAAIWEAALNSLGVSPALLSATPGRA
ncbi:YqgE/AlgH family protein [Pseudooceanicola sp.]|uniref:YqgE/AlgH family protein n=1 Tax=Pseudooceanicola sp. TaxID=1914328 RepID=UPI00262817FF|nr:YqgE/AlgH family protein [Pseudooceanicola sp.]MDF1855337.1 YqgE/AlgH family protein [Pseudooceanicola sp.]